MNTTIFVILAIVILLIAFKKEIVALFQTIVGWISKRQENSQEKKLSPETKRLLKKPGVSKFLLMMGAIAIIAIIIITTFLVSILILPYPAGYIVGGILALAELIGSIAVCCEAFDC